MCEAVATPKLWTYNPPVTPLVVKTINGHRNGTSITQYVPDTLQGNQNDTSVRANFSYKLSPAQHDGEYEVSL